jgi:hypothetical protein
MTDPGRSSSDAAPLARALLDQALLTFRSVPEAERVPALTAIDSFLSGPSPSRFLAAIRLLAQARRRLLIDRTASTTLQRARADGLSALRDVPGFPGHLVDRLEATLPADPRSGRRLMALAALARSYQELAGRVAADTEQMRQRLRDAFPRRGSRRRPPRA